MNRPSTNTYLFGNPLAVTAAAVATLCAAYEWWTGQVSGFVPLAALIAAAYAANANGELRKYQGWQREWNAIGGQRNADASAILRSWPVRLFVGIPLWLLLAYWSIQPSNDPAMHLGALLFWLATATAVGALSMKRSWMYRHSRIQNSRDVSVSYCLKQSLNSSTLARARSELPEYCLSLFNM